MSKKYADDNGVQAAGIPPALSLVMIVRDEEAYLPRALASAKPWVDETIVVDTGSTDRTVEIAKEFKAKVYHHPWENDFSLHRNQALSYATGDWCLQLDADEALDQKTAPLMRRLAQDASNAAYMVQIVNVFSSGAQTVFHWPRFFRRLPGTRYQRPVHNQLSVAGRVAMSSLRLFHYGYDAKEDVMRARQSRRLLMIRHWARIEPQNWEAHCYLAQTLVAQPATVRESVQESLRALALVQAQGVDPAGLSRIYLPLLQGLEQLKMAQQVIPHALAWSRLAPLLPDPLLYLGRAHYHLGQWREAQDALERFCLLHQKAPAHQRELAHFEINTQGLIYSALVILTVVKWRMGARPQALAVFDGILSLPEAEQAAKLAAVHAREKGLMELSLSLAQKAAAVRPQWAWPAAILTGGARPGRVGSPPVVKWAAS